MKIETPIEQFNRQRDNFPEFSDNQFIRYSADIAMMVWKGDLTQQDMDDVLDGKRNLMDVMDERGL